MKQPSPRLRFLENLVSYRCMTVRQSIAAGLASEQMTRRYFRELTQDGLLRITPWQTDQTGRPENLAIPTPKGLKTIGLVGRTPIQSRFYAHQLLVNWCRIRFQELSEYNLEPDFRVRSVNDFWPDGILTLRSSALDKSLLFFLELDRGTESLNSKRPGNLRQKVDAYRELFLSGDYTSLASSADAFTGFRSLFVFTSVARLRSFTRLCSLIEPCPFVWSTDFNSIYENGASGRQWIRGGSPNERFSILGSLAPQ